MSKVGSDEFRNPASDTKGHHERQWFRCQPYIAGIVAQIVQSKIFPYRTKGDLLRHALHRQIDWLKTLSDDPIFSVTGQVDIMLGIMRDDEMAKDFSAVFTTLERRISEHVNNKEENEAIRLLLMIKKPIEDMPDGYWKERYQQHINDKYGKLLERSTKLKLGQLE